MTTMLLFSKVGGEFSFSIDTFSFIVDNDSTMNQKQEFWTCVIGPADRNTLPKGSDFPLRMAVKEAFELISGHPDEICMSGWGNDSETAAKASVKRDFVYAVNKTNTPEPELRKFTSGELLQLVTNFAKEYAVKGVESIRRNNHMNKVSIGDELSKNVVDAVLVDFINYIGLSYGVDFGLYIQDLTDSKKFVEFEVEK
jgi:hypothetical protein